MRLGLFGGTFDPPHVGHVLAASDAVEALALDRVVWIPAAMPPLKRHPPSASAADRLAMVRLTCAHDARFGVDPIEVDRGGLSFTVDTLRTYRERHPGAALFLLLGADAAASLPAWRDSDAVRTLAEVAVVTRGEEGGMVPAARVATRRVDVSSTDVRARVRAGRALTGFVPAAVAEYIEAHGLYRKDETTGIREHE